jgi:hypothetical protein
MRQRVRATAPDVGARGVVAADGVLVRPFQQAVHLPVGVVVQLDLADAELVGLAITRIGGDLLDRLGRQLQVLVRATSVVRCRRRFGSAGDSGWEDSEAPLPDAVDDQGEGGGGNRRADRDQGDLPAGRAADDHVRTTAGGLAGPAGPAVPGRLAKAGAAAPNTLRPIRPVRMAA